MIEEIIRDAGMSARPGYYSGRGATTSDLRSEHLEKIYQGIVKEYGKTEAENFVDMVEAMKEMSATAFLNELYSLAGNGFEFNKIAGHSGIDFDKDENSNHSEAQVFATLASAMSPSGRDCTPEIKNPFLSRHGRKIERSFSRIGDKYF